MRVYVISYETAYGIDHARLTANNKTEARKTFNANKPIKGSKIVDITEV